MLNKLEIDVMQANELYEAAKFTVKYKLPAMVVHQDLSGEAYIIRSQLGGKFKLITPIDWPKGNSFGMNKMRGLSTDALEVEGFEILLTSGKNLLETKNEAKALTDFIKSHLSEKHEIRFVLGTQSNNEDSIKLMCEALVGIRTPSYIRNDTQLKLQVSKANTEIHNNTCSTILGIIRAPLKVAGNINSLRSMASCKHASRFGVNLSQAKIISKEFQNQPSTELRELLSE